MTIVKSASAIDPQRPLPPKKIREIFNSLLNKETALFQTVVAYRSAVERSYSIRHDNASLTRDIDFTMFFVVMFLVLLMARESTTSSMATYFSTLLSLNGVGILSRSSFNTIGYLHRLLHRGLGLSASTPMPKLKKSQLKWLRTYLSDQKALSGQHLSNDISRKFKAIKESHRRLRNPEFSSLIESRFVHIYQEKGDEAAKAYLRSIAIHEDTNKIALEFIQAFRKTLTDLQVPPPLTTLCLEYFDGAAP